MIRRCIILNPWAGRGMAGRRRAELEHMLHANGIAFDLITTHARGGATELTYQAIERGYNQIIAVGGDGTINEIVNGIMGSRSNVRAPATLGIVPLGTGSDFIKVLDGVRPNDLTGAVRRIAIGRTSAVDVGRIRARNPFQEHERYFINGMGMGVDAQVTVESLKITHFKGRAVYLMAILRALSTYRAYPMSVRFDQQQIHKRMLFTSIANGRCQGGSFWMTPEALINDGWLDLCMVDHLRPDQIMRYLPLLMRGTHTRLRYVTMGRARHITVDCVAPFPVAADGEVIATDARHVEVEVLPGAIEVVG